MRFGSIVKEFGGDMSIKVGDADVTIGGVEIKATGEVLTEEQHIEKAAEHFKEAIHHDLMATMLRDPRVGTPETTPEIYRHCGVQPGDTWVERVERLNAIIDGMREERGEPLTLDDQLRMLAEDA